MDVVGDTTECCFLGFGLTMFLLSFVVFSMADLFSVWLLAMLNASAIVFFLLLILPLFSIQNGLHFSPNAIFLQDAVL